jgi:hypothetical protein
MNRNEMTTFSTESVQQVDLHCRQCGYNLRGIESNVCPECGLPIDRAAFAQSQLPWSHRRRIGYIRAYLRTLGMALLDSRRLAAEVARPVSYRDAQLFRLITVTLAWIPLAALVISAREPMHLQASTFIAQNSRSFAPMLPTNFWIWWPWVVGATAPAVAPIAIALLLLLVSGVQSYYFHPRGVPIPLQNRAIALSYYACAPILLLPVIPILILAVHSLASTFSHGSAFRMVMALGFVAAALPAITIAWAWITTVRLHRRIVHASTGASLLLALTLPLAWIICAAFSLGAVVWVIGFVDLVIHSVA